MATVAERSSSDVCCFVVQGYFNVTALKCGFAGCKPVTVPKVSLHVMFALLECLLFRNLHLVRGIG